MSGLRMFGRWPGRGRHLSAVYEPLSGRVAFVGQSHDAHPVLLHSEAAAAAWLLQGRRGYEAERSAMIEVVAATRVQLPVLFNTARTDLAILTAAEAPIRRLPPTFSDRVD